MKIKVVENVFIRHNEIITDRQSIWFLHGFADSGLAYLEAFDSPIANNFNIYVVDLPGFGASPINHDFLSIKGHSELVTGIIKDETNEQQKVNLVAHSLGGLIGTWVCQNLSDMVNYYVSIEGNLTEADSYFSSKPLDYSTPIEFSRAFNKDIFKLAEKEERYKRYYSSLRFANPEGMRNWSITSQEFNRNNNCGLEFNALECNKIYLWGDKDTPKETQEFINRQKVPNKLYPSIGHWHMIENTEALYADICSFILGNNYINI